MKLLIQIIIIVTGLSNNALASPNGITIVRSTKPVQRVQNSDGTLHTLHKLKNNIKVTVVQNSHGTVTHGIYEKSNWLGVVKKRYKLSLNSGVVDSSGSFVQMRPNGRVDQTFNNIHAHSSSMESHYLDGSHEHYTDTTRRFFDPNIISAGSMSLSPPPLNASRTAPTQNTHTPEMEELPSYSAGNYNRMQQIPSSSGAVGHSVPPSYSELNPMNPSQPSSSSNSGVSD